jgi:hypothetical protein
MELYIPVITFFAGWILGEVIRYYVRTYNV